ncbi:MAG: HAD family hydrolase [Marivita sp.]|uniref:HAD family hydrolase n=1 Tax=Marivita sp. TaxID=2003365 RepID=UPI0025B8BECC|nr:HAD family hydrolase [Marivita sp.]MCI5111729.1 HAD family hydrolase [Marivita sp.]
MTPADPQTIEAILFDKDGTLFDFGATWNAWAKSLLLRLAEGNEARAAALGQVIGFDWAAGVFNADSLVIAGTPDEVVETLSPACPTLSRAELLALINEEAAAAPMAPAVPLAPLLDRLIAAGLRLGVATNDAEAPAFAHLDSAGVRDRFAFIAGSDSGHGAKPEPGQLLAFCSAVGVTPDRALMVGDSTHDLIAGRAAGMRTVAVLTGLAGRAELEPFADLVFPNIGHLADWLGLH